MNRIRVNLDRRLSASYDIHIGNGILDRMALILAKGNWAARWFVVSDDAVAGLHGGRVLAALAGAGLRAGMLTVPPGEGAKTVSTCLGLAEDLLERDADRASGLIALGGGVIGDVTGFLASIYMRGLPLVQIPTTLLAQVDSSIGGKTGVDLPAGKNLLGTFLQPRAVFIDIGFLDTLPREEFTNGLAEIVKYGLIEDPGLLEVIEGGTAALERRDPAILERLVSASCRIKKGVVEIDETEKGLRRILNFGHTVGHALEKLDPTLAHGEAVAVGMAVAAELSHRRGYITKADADRVRAILAATGLPATTAHRAGDIAATMRADKKKSGDTLAFVLLNKIGEAVVVDIPFTELEVTLATVCQHR